jgi:hypothetical protein
MGAWCRDRRASMGAKSVRQVRMSAARSSMDHLRVAGSDLSVSSPSLPSKRK